MSSFNVGDEVRITHEKSFFYNQVGTIININDNSVFPYGIEVSNYKWVFYAKEGEIALTA